MERNKVFVLERQRERASGKGRRKEGWLCCTSVRKCDHPRRGASIPPSSLRPHPCSLQRLLSPPISPDHLLGGRWSALDRGVPGFSARRPPPGVRRSAGGILEVSAGLRVNRQREPWLRAPGKTRLDPLPDARDAGSDRATEHLFGYYRHSF